MGFASSSTRLVRSTVAVLLWMLCLTGAVAAQEPVEDPEEPAAQIATEETATEETATEPVQGAAGQWIFLDPETGERLERPTPEQAERMRAWDASLNKSDQGLEPFPLEDGGQGVYLQGRFRHALVAFLAEDGRIGYRCSDHPDEILLPDAGSDDPRGGETAEEAPVR